MAKQKEAMTKQQEANPFDFGRYADGLEADFLLGLYEALLRPRMIEERMLILLRQGGISKWFSGIGQEAINVAVVAALSDEDYILPMHRNLGIFTGRGVDYGQLFSQWMGHESGFTSGRDRSFHFGSLAHRLVGMISHLGAQLPIANGLALGALLKGEKAMALAFTGDGGTSEGDFHEALNVASVWDLPVIFLIESNGYGLSTPSVEQFRCKALVDRAAGYGMESERIEGNCVLAVYQSIKRWRRALIRKPRPVLIEADTFRMRGHEEASGTKYVPKALMDYWAARDPVACYAAWLRAEGLLGEAQEKAYRSAIQADIAKGLAQAQAASAPVADAQKEHRAVYAPNLSLSREAPIPQAATERRFVDAIQDALRQALDDDPNLILMGQDIAEYGGVFKVTEGFLETYGPTRIRNTPLCESAIIGAALGLAIQGIRSVVEMQFADFVSCGFNQIVNNLAKVHYRWGQAAPVVIRMPTGAGVSAGPFHSQSNEAWFFHTPGLKILYPSTPYDAKGLLLAAIADPNPCLFFEHKKLYRSLKGKVPDNAYTIPIGVSKSVRTGTDASIITYGMGVHWALACADTLPYSFDIIDLRALLPWDKEAVRASVQKTGRAFVLHEDTLVGGIGAEVAAWISTHLFEYLDAPVERLGSWDTPVPFAASLEKAFLPDSRLKEALLRWMKY